MSSPTRGCSASRQVFAPSSQTTSVSGNASQTAAAYSGKSVWHRKVRLCETLAMYTTSSGVMRKFVGTQTAPSRKVANIDSNISLLFFE
ncbi:hypothetical protein D3C86_1479190 [compost metagenome]